MAPEVEVHALATLEVQGSGLGFLGLHTLNPRP